MRKILIYDAELFKINISRIQINDFNPIKDFVPINIFIQIRVKLNYH